MHSPVGAHLTKDGASFRLWAPRPRSVDLHITAPSDGVIPMEKCGDFWRCEVQGARAGTRYFFRLNGKDDRPDPASRFQPDGVHAASELVDPAFPWTDDSWAGLPLHQLVFYELHVGTFTPEGTFEGIIPQLPRLKSLGINAIELMPVCQFPGERNWGYDGVYPYAPQHSYGGPAGLKKFIDAAHRHGIAVVLDVIYNHLGPEGNYFSSYAPYFTDSYKTPWGDAINFDGPDSGPVREFFIQNAEYWVREFHIDALRLDAVHEIYDTSPVYVLAELQERITALGKQLNRSVHVIAESDANNTRHLSSPAIGGYGLDGQWLDDFHHSLYTHIADTNSRHYDIDYCDAQCVEKAFAEGFVYSGQYCPSRKRRHGTNSASIPADRFVVFMQNHDQVGNKIRGTRLAAEVSFEAAKLAAASYILSPYLPLLFMGEEILETRPFMFFVDHSDPQLVEAVREGRQRDFMTEHDTGEFPDPQSRATFKRCILDFKALDDPEKQNSRSVLTSKYYQELIRLRRKAPAISPVRRDDTYVRWLEENQTLLMRRETREGASLLLLNFATTDSTVRPFDALSFAGQEDRHFGEECQAISTATGWRLVLNSAASTWGGPEEIADTPTGNNQRTTPGTLKEDTSEAITIYPESALLYIRNSE